MSEVILSGAFVGIIYGLVGIGLVVVYRGSHVLNFAYGETGMLGAFVFTEIRFGISSSSYLGATTNNGLWLALPFGIAVAAALGAFTELICVRPLRDGSRLRPMIATFALGSLFVVYASRRWGTNPLTTAPLIQGAGVRVLGLQIQPEDLLILAVSVVVLLGLWVMNRFTPFGLRLRSTAIDPYATRLVGVNVNRTSLATWALAGALSGLSAILIAPLVSFDVTFMTTLAIQGLAAALIGGLTNVGATFAAGILIGVAGAVIGYESTVTGLADVLVACLILLLVVIRPSGLSARA